MLFVAVGDVGDPVDVVGTPEGDKLLLIEVVVAVDGEMSGGESERENKTFEFSRF